MSEWDGFLEALAQEIAQAVLMDAPESLDDDGTEPANRILRAKLLPLLEAGQAMRMNIGAYAVALNASPFKQEDTSRAIRGCIDGLQAWDTALKVALKK